MPIIPHGNTLQQRLDYSGRVRPHATGHYDFQRKLWQGRTVQNVRLVEVWIPKSGAHSASDVEIHPSRNPFHPVSDDSQKKIWHSLATGAIRSMPESVFASAVHAQARHGKSPAPPPTATPNWATQGNVIGYTCALEIPWRGTESEGEIYIFLLDQGTFAGEDLKSYPTVYYEGGRRTLDHKNQSNVDWHGRTPQKCLFFGNVPTAYL
jgi:hypothetical protein